MNKPIRALVFIIATAHLATGCVEKEIDADINVAATKLFFNGVFNEGITDIVKFSLSPDYTYNGHPSKVEGTIAWAKSLRKSYPDLHFAINDLFGSGHKVAIRWTMTGTGSDGVEITTSGTNILTFKDGKAVSNWQNGGTAADVHPVSNDSS